VQQPAVGRQGLDGLGTLQRCQRVGFGLWYLRCLDRVIVVVVVLMMMVLLLVLLLLLLMMIK
jgi:hypothetical protein